MNLKALITTLVLGTSSAAMASPSFRADASWTASTVSTVRDHRTPMPAPQSYGHHFTSKPPVVFASEDCSNWDPTVDSSNCGREARFDARTERPWTDLGSRDSAMSDHQYITVETAFRELRLQTLSGAPAITKVAVRYMDGSTQVTQLRGCNEPIGLSGKQISQIVMYTAPGSRGVYTVYAV